MGFANAVWVDDSYADFRKEYVQEVRKIFAAPLHRVSFAQRDAVSAEINNWIAGATRGKIPTGVAPEDFASRSGSGVIDEPGLVSVNAVYFKADWAGRFERDATRKAPFHVNASITKETMMMHQSSLLNYSEDHGFQFLEIPYVDNVYSMYVVLPRKVVGVRTLMREITPEVLAGLRRAAYPHQVDVLFPKFEIRSHLGVRDALSAMGVKSAFDRQEANFDRMITKNLEAFRIYLSEVHHDAWIDVREEGVAAAAATATVHRSFGCSAPALPVPAKFHADHPFLFLIVHNESRSALFAGWISKPPATAGLP